MKIIRFSIKLYFTFLCCFLLNGSGVFAQDIQNSLLWEISGKQLESKSYLMGTIHMIEKDFELPEKVWDKFNQCQALVLEVNLNLSLKEQLAFINQVNLPKDKSLKDYMEEKDYNRLIAYLADSLELKNRQINQIKNMKPVFSQTLLIKQKMDNADAIDIRFFRRAKKKSMEIKGLETIQFQMDLMNSINMEEQVKWFMEFVDKPQETDSLFFAMIDAYKSEDINRLAHIISDESLNAVNFEEDFLIKRNQKWIPLIIEYIKEKPSFIAVGTGHLPGKNGLITLLRKQGYTIKPVNN